MATYINNNVKFHAFSKSPVSPDTTLGGAVNPSGHTITTSQVRAQDIPAFLNTFQGTKEQAITWLGTNYATPAHNDIVFYGGEFKAGFSTPKCLKYNAKAETPAWEDFDITKATTLKNADDKDVIAVHQDCTTVFVDGGNNAATNSNRWSLFVKKSDGSILDHFVASTDKIVAGMPSLGYNALVMWKGAAIDEGELEANYVGNTFAGIIHLNKQYATGDDTNNFTVTCFEYIGDKLDTTLGNIREEIQDIVGVTMEGVVASVGTNDAATSAGIGVDSTTKTSPKITFTAGSVATGETKLVSGGAVKTYVDTTALAEGGSIAKAIADYVATNAKVSVNGQSATTITVAGTAEGSADLVKVVVTEDKTTENKIGLTLTATLDAAVLNEDGSIDKDGVVIATIAKDIAEAVADTAITNAITTDNGAIKDAIDTAISNATLADGQKIATTTDTSKLVTVEDVTTYVSENAKVTLTQGTGITVTPNGEASTSFTVAVDDTVATKQSVDDLSGLVSALPATIEAAQDTADAAKATADTAVQIVKVNGSELTKNGTEVDITAIVGVDETLANGIKVTKTTDNKVKVSVEPATYTSSNKEWRGSDYFATASSVAAAISDAVGAITIPDVTTSTAAQNVGVTASGHEVSVSTATYTASTDTWTNKPYLVTGATVEAYVTDVVSEVSSDLTALENKVNAYHEAGVSYKVHTGTELPDLSVVENVELYKNVILLVPTSTKRGETDLDDTEAMSGGYIEYLCVKTGETTYAWEKIGTTEADLEGYVRAITESNGANHTSPVYASISSLGYLTLGIDSATSDKLGVSKMFTDALSPTASNVVDTAVSVQSAQNMYIALASLANGKVASVTEAEYLNLAGLAVHTYNANDVSIKSQNIKSIDEPFIINSSNVIGVKDCTLVDRNGIGIRIDTSVFAFGEDVNCQNFFSSNTKPKIEYWSGDMPNLKGGGYMFDSCTALTSFCGDLSSLKTGGYMFRGCDALTSFCGDLSSLTDGRMMFSGCSLDAESLECIAETLPTVSGGTIDVGASTNATDEVIATIKGKGWTVMSNNIII